MKPTAAALLMRIIAVLSMLLSVTFAASVAADPAGLADLFFRHASSGGAGLAGIATAEAKLSTAIAGGIFAGLSAMLWLIAAPAIAAGDRGVIRSVMLTLLTWFMVDSGASALGGNAANIIPNIAVLLLYLAPMLLVRHGAETRRNH